MLFIERDRSTGFVQQESIHNQSAVLFAKRNIRVTSCGDNAAPVGVVASDGCLDEGTVGHGLGNTKCFVPCGEARNLNRDEVLGPFSVADDLL